MKTPLSKPYVDADIVKNVADVLLSGRYILGDQCKAFEKEFSNYINLTNAVLTSSGTSALFLILKALGIGPGDGVIVPSFTAFPTVEPVFQVGARPIFADIDSSMTINPKHVRAILDNRKSYPVKIRAIIPVHLYGNPANMVALEQVKREYEVFLIEDCCQAHGAKMMGIEVGAIGEAGFFSFYPSKNMTVLGDGGMIVTNSNRIADACRMLRDHGREEKYHHQVVGYNMRCNEIQAAIGRVQLSKLDEFNEKRREIAAYYDERLREFPISFPVRSSQDTPVYHLYVILVTDRDKLALYLRQKGIETGIHYPVPCHLQPAVIHSMGYQQKLIYTEAAADRVLSLPLYPELEDDEIDYVCDAICNYFEENKNEVLSEVA